MEIAGVALSLIENIVAMVKQAKDASAEQSAAILERLSKADAALVSARDEAHAELDKLEGEAGK